jgi:hypothetical protein
MSTKENTGSNFADTFLSKLKEQSFTIILLVGIMYYQNQRYQEQASGYKKMIDDKEAIIMKLNDDERQRLIERCDYLVEQRDKYVEELINNKFK